MTKNRCNTLWCIEYSSRRGKYHDEAIQCLQGKHINVLQQKFPIKGMSWQWGQQRLQNVGNHLQGYVTSQLRDHNWNTYSKPVLPVSALPKPKLAAHITEGLMFLQTIIWLWSTKASCPGLCSTEWKWVSPKIPLDDQTAPNCLYAFLSYRELQVWLIESCSLWDWNPLVKYQESE